jgi:hypothetical protein
MMLHPSCAPRPRGEPGFKADFERLPAVLVRFSISPDFEEREPNRNGSEHQGAVDEALNRIGLLPVDTTFATGSGDRRSRASTPGRPWPAPARRGPSTFSSWTRG